MIKIMQYLSLSKYNVIYINFLPLQTIDNKLEKQAQGALYPVKKRAYNEADPPHINRYDLQPSQDYSNMEMNLSVGRQANMAPIIDETNNKQYMQQAKQTQQETSPVMQQQVQQEIESREENVSFSTAANIAYNSSYVADTYPLNIPVSRGAEHRELDGKIDMLKYTNMGYTGSDLAFARNATQFTGFSRSSAVEQQQQQQANSSGDLNMGIRYSSTPGKLVLFTLYVFVAFCVDLFATMLIKKSKQIYYV